MAQQVKVAQSSIAKARREMGGNDTWLQLRTEAGVIDDFARAIGAANQAAADRGEGDEAFAAFPAPTPQGFAVQLVRATTLLAVRRWAADVATALTAAGFTGTIGGAPYALAPACLFPTLPPVLTGYIAWTLDPSAFADDGRKAAGWLVSPDATPRIAQLADRWARRPGATVHLRQKGYTMAIQLDDAAPHLAQAVTETGMAGLDFVIDAGFATHTALCFGGEGVFQVVGGPDDWRYAVDQLTHALCALPGDTNQAYIRIGHRGARSHDGIDSLLPLPGTKEYEVRYNKHLLGRYLPDAHGVQVVRTAHLDNASNLSGWQITDLGSGRHLVQAPDLTAWYAEALPDPEVLAQARADFAGALITDQVIIDNPFPW